MTGALKRVLVRPRSPRTPRAGASNGWRAAPDHSAAAAEHEGFRALLEEAGAEVVVSRHEPGNPDAMYVYDPVLVGEEGAVLLRPGKEGRRGEPAALEGALGAASVPVAAALAAPALAEGGDTVWLDARTLMGIGYRTNAEAVPALEAAFPGVEVVPFDLHWNGAGEVMHLMSFISPLDDDLAESSIRESLRFACCASRGTRDRGRRRAGRRVRVQGGERPRARAATRRSRSTATRRRGGGWSGRASTWSSTEARRSRRRATAGRPVSRALCCASESGQGEAERKSESGEEPGLTASGRTPRA